MMTIWFRSYGKDTTLTNVVSYAYDAHSRTLNVSLSDGTDMTFDNVNAIGA